MFICVVRANNLIVSFRLREDCEWPFDPLWLIAIIAIPIILIIVVAVVFGHPKLRRRVMPYRDRNRFTAQPMTAQ